MSVPSTVHPHVPSIKNAVSVLTDVRAKEYVGLFSLICCAFIYAPTPLFR